MCSGRGNAGSCTQDRRDQAFFRARNPRRFGCRATSPRVNPPARFGPAIWSPIRTSDIDFEIFMHRYRTHTCGALRESHIGEIVRLSGWCHRIRDHGGVLFIDLRDHYGITQCVIDPDSPSFKDAERLRSEWVVRMEGKVRHRPEGTDNPELPTGTVELYVRDIEVLSPAGELPLPVFGEQDYPEDIRLKYRFLDLRRERLHQNIMTRGAVVDSMRRRMKEQGFF